MADDDAKLVRAAIRGDEDAFRELVESYAAMAAGIAYSVTGDAEAARDLAQDAFCDAYRNLRRLRSAGKFAGWLAGIARRKSVSWVRSRARSRLELAGGHEELAAAVGNAPGEDVEREEARRRVLAAVRGLPPGYREAIVLRCLEERRHSEICSALGITAAALDKRLTRAKTMLREVLGDLAPDYGSDRPGDGGGANRKGAAEEADGEEPGAAGSPGALRLAQDAGTEPVEGAGAKDKGGRARLKKGKRSDGRSKSGRRKRGGAGSGS